MLGWARGRERQVNGLLDAPVASLGSGPWRRLGTRGRRGGAHGPDAGHGMCGLGYRRVRRAWVGWVQDRWGGRPRSPWPHGRLSPVPSPLSWLNSLCAPQCLLDPHIDGHPHTKPSFPTPPPLPNRSACWTPSLRTWTFVCFAMEPRASAPVACPTHSGRCGPSGGGWSWWGLCCAGRGAPRSRAHLPLTSLPTSR